MSDFTAFSLFSGSKGNVAFVATKKAQILIDAGMSARSIEASLNALGTSLSCVTDIFITHDHSDHTKGLESICKKYDVKVHMTKASADVVISKSLTPCLVQKSCLHPLIYEFDIEDLHISSFATPHDSRASVGFVIKSPTHTLGYATDLGYVTDTVKERLMGVDSVIIEANHDVLMLEEGPYPRFLKERILSRFGHLSNEDCAAFCAELAEGGTKHFLLAHLSEQNNIPEEAFFTVYSTLANIEKRGITLALAEPDRPVKLV